MFVDGGGSFSRRLTDEVEVFLGGSKFAVALNRGPTTKVRVGTGHVWDALL